MDKNIEYLIIETIKGWMHRMIGDIPTLEKRQETKRGLILIVIKSFKLVINQVWLNRCKHFVEWKQMQEIMREKIKKNFCSNAQN